MVPKEGLTQGEGADTLTSPVLEVNLPEASLEGTKEIHEDMLSPMEGTNSLCIFMNSTLLVFMC